MGIKNHYDRVHAKTFVDRRSLQKQEAMINKKADEITTRLVENELEEATVEGVVEEVRMEDLLTLIAPEEVQVGGDAMTSDLQQSDNLEKETTGDDETVEGVVEEIRMDDLLTLIAPEEDPVGDGRMRSVQQSDVLEKGA